MKRPISFLSFIASSFLLAGSVIAAPEIEVSDGTTVIADGTNTVDVSKTTTKMFFVKNVGDAPLELLSPVTFSNGGAGFMVDSFATPTTVSPNTAVTFQVTLTAVDEGTYTGTLAFDNADSDESPFSFAITAVIKLVAECGQGNLGQCVTETTCAAAGGVYVAGQCGAAAFLIHPEKGSSVSIDSSAKQTWNTATQLKGGVAVDGGQLVINSEFKATQTLAWAANMIPNPAHVGRKVDILFVVGIEPPSTSDPLVGYSGDMDTEYFAYDGKLEKFFPINLYVPANGWATELAKLTTAPFKENVTLPSSLSLELWRGKVANLTSISQGRFYTFVGYVFTDGVTAGTIVYNGMPIISTLNK